MSHVLPITWHLIISLCFSTQNWFLIFPASIGNTLRNPPLYLDGRVKHHIEGRSDKFEDRAGLDTTYFTYVCPVFWC